MGAEICEIGLVFIPAAVRRAGLSAEPVGSASGQRDDSTGSTRLSESLMTRGRRRTQTVSPTTRDLQVLVGYRESVQNHPADIRGPAGC